MYEDVHLNERKATCLEVDKPVNESFLVRSIVANTGKNVFKIFRFWWFFLSYTRSHHGALMYPCTRKNSKTFKICQTFTRIDSHIFSRYLEGNFQMCASFVELCLYLTQIERNASSINGKLLTTVFDSGRTRWCYCVTMLGCCMELMSVDDYGILCME